MQLFIIKITNGLGATTEKVVKMASAFAAIRYARKAAGECERLVVQSGEEVVFMSRG